MTRPAWKQVLLGGFAILTSGLAAIGFVLRSQPVSSIPRLVLVVGSPYLAAASVVALAAAIVGRRRILAVVAACVAVVLVAVQASWYFFGANTSAHRSVAVRVLSSNLRHGLADPDQFVTLARDNADVITVAELTEEAVQRFGRAGIDRVFPYSLLFPAPGAGGVGIWSRYPIRPFTAARHHGVNLPAVRLSVPGVADRPILASIHVTSPVAGNQDTITFWSTGMASSLAQLDNFAREGGPAAVIIGGDYNSTPDMRQFRDLLTHGYTDAVDQLGAGFAPTFPSDTAIPPVITIDHILTRNATPASIRTVQIDGSDHMALLATVLVPVAP